MRPARPLANRRRRRLQVEPLERRVLLDAAGLPATIDGTVIEDCDLDVAQDIGEPGQADWTVELGPTGDYLRSHDTEPDGPMSGPDSAAIAADRYLIGECKYQRAAVYLYDLTSGELLRTFHDPLNQGDGGSEAVNASNTRFGLAVAFAGRNVLVSSDYGVYLFDGDTGDLLHTFPIGTASEDIPSIFSTSPLVAGSDELVLIGGRGHGDTRLYDAATGELLHTFAPEDEFTDSVNHNTMRQVELVGDKVLFSVGRSFRANNVYVYDVHTGALLRTLEVADPAWRGRLLDTGGDLAAFQGDEKVFVLDINSGELVHTFEDPAPDYRTRYDDPATQTGAQLVSRHPVGRSAALIDGGILLGAPSPGDEIYLGRVYHFDLATGELLATYRHPTPSPVPSWFSPETGQSYSEPGPGRFLETPSVGLTIYDMEIFGQNLVADGQHFIVGGCLGGGVAHLYRLPEPQPAVAGEDELPVIDGTVFEDRDLDGTQDVGEPGLADWTIELIPSGDHLRSYNTHPGGILQGPESTAIEGGRYLLGESGPRKSEAYLFDPATGELLLTFQDPLYQDGAASPAAADEPSRFGSAVAFAGRNVLVSSIHHVYLFDGDTGELLQTFPSGVVRESIRVLTPATYPLVAGSDDLVLIGSPGRGDTRLYSAATGELLQTFAPPDDELHEGIDKNTVRNVKLVGDKVVCSVGGYSKSCTVYVYDAYSGALLRTLEVADPAWRGRLLDAEGELAAFAGDEKVFVLDINSGELVHTFEDPYPEYWFSSPDIPFHAVGATAAFVDGGILLGAAAHGSDTQYGRVYHFDLESGELLTTVEPPYQAPAVTWFDPNTGQSYSQPGPGLIERVTLTGPMEYYGRLEFGRNVASDGQYFLVGGNGTSAAHLYTVFQPQFANGEDAVTVTTDADGNFQLDDVQPGNYQVHVRPPKSDDLSTGTWSVPVDRTVTITGAEGLSELNLGSFVSIDSLPMDQAEDLGGVDFLHVNDIDLSGGERWYQFQTALGAGGRLLSLVASDSEAVIELYDSSGELLATSAEGRLDRQGTVSDAVGQYYCRLSGVDNAVNLSIANLVELQTPDNSDQTANTVKVWGTPSDDLFRFNAQDRTLQINGIQYDLGAELFMSFFGGWMELVSVDFAGSDSAEDGHDTARITGTSWASDSWDQTIELRPQWGNLAAAPIVLPEGEFLLAEESGLYYGGLSVTAGGAEVLTIDANGGHSSAVFQDSPGDDLFVATPTYAGLSGDGFKSEVYGCASVQAHATAGGSDVVKMFDSAGDDLFVAAPKYGKLSGQGFNNEAVGFSNVHTYATAGGFDTAKLFDSAADDVFYADPMQACLFNSGAYFNRAKHFEAVHAYAVAGGHDVAQLFGSAENDVFYADPVQSALYRPGHFYNRAKHFEEVYGDGLGGDDQAELHDSALNDLLEADDSWAKLSNLDLGSLQQVTDFAHVEAFSSTGTNRRALSGPLSFALQHDDTWEWITTIYSTPLEPTVTPG